MTVPVLIKRFGTLIEISLDGKNPLPPDVVKWLMPLLTYDHKTLLRGYDRYDPDGNKRGMSIEKRRMYTMEFGRLVTGFGFLTSIVDILRRHDTEPGYVDISPQRPRPNCYQTDWDRVHRHLEFRSRQEDCLRLISQNEVGLINAPPAFGKTFMFEALALLYPYAKIDIVVRPRDVATRIVQQLTRSIPNVGIVGGGKKQYGDRVTVYTAGSVHHSDGDCDFMLADECHLLVTGQTGRQLGEIYRYCRIFGFTATPKGRLDGADAQLEMFFGRQIFRMTYQEGVELGVVVPIKVRWLPITMTYNPADGKTDVARMRWGIWRNEQRNALIAQDVHENYGNPETQVLILVATIDHAVHLWKHLPEFALCYSDLPEEELERYQRNKLLPQGFRPVTPDVREQMRSDFAAGTLKKVIATDVWATGVDFTGLQVLYRADARESVILDTQAPGRVSRIADGKEFGIVVDCDDQFDRALARKADNRRRHYRELGWEQEKPVRSRDHV